MSINLESLQDALIEYLEIASLPENDKAVYNIILRYQEKVSARLLALKASLRKTSKELLSEHISHTNPVISLVPKDGDIWQGQLVVPLRKL